MHTAATSTAHENMNNHKGGEDALRLAALERAIVGTRHGQPRARISSRALPRLRELCPDRVAYAEAIGVFV